MRGTVLHTTLLVAVAISLLATATATADTPEATTAKPPVTIDPDALPVDESAPSVAVTTEEAVNNPVDRELQPQLHDLGAIWPLPGVSRTLIGTTFGPCILPVVARYHFSRAVFIAADEDTPVRAVLDGVVHAVHAAHPSEGALVVLRHDTDAIPLHAANHTTVFSVYMQLSEIANGLQAATVGMPVSKGDVIGRVGQSGSRATAPGLRFEVRVGSACTLQEQRAGNEGVGGACSNVGFDPAVHPLGLFAVPPEDSGLTVVTEAMASEKDEAVVSVTAPAAFPTANRFELRVKRADGWVEIISTLDFSLRTGYDEDEGATLDTPDTSLPYLNPMPFTQDSTEWKVEYRVPPAYAAKVEGDMWELVAVDIFGTEVSTEVASIDLNWV